MLGLISITGVKHLPALLAKNFSDDPNFFCTVSLEPLVIYNCALYNWKLSHHLQDIRLISIVTLKSWLGVTQGHQKLYHSIRHPWLPINIHSNHRPISHCFRDKRRYPSKIANFYHPPCIKRPRWRGFPWNWVSAQGISNASMTGLPDGWQIFKIGLVILIQYRLWQMDAHPATQPRCRSKDAAYYVVQVIKTKWAGLWAQTSIPKSWS